MMAYSTSRIEFLVTMPISISRPISAGMEKLIRVISSESSAPPSDSGSAHRMVAGCRKSWNSSTSTAYTQKTPMAMARPKLWNSSLMFCSSPCWTWWTPAGKCCSAGSCCASWLTSPMVRPLSSTDSVMLRARSSRSICDGPLPMDSVPTEATVTLPLVPATRNWPMASRSCRKAGSMRARIAICRSGRFSLGSAVE